MTKPASASVKEKGKEKPMRTYEQLQKQFRPTINSLTAGLIIIEHVLGYFLAKFQIHIVPDEKAGDRRFRGAPGMTDGRDIYLVPGNMETTPSPGVIQFIIVHEVCHLFLNHHDRRGYRDPILWNLAADCEIHEQFIRPHLRNTNVSCLPAARKSTDDIEHYMDSLCISAKYLKKANDTIDPGDPAEIIFDKLKKEQDKIKIEIVGFGSGDGSGDGDGDGDGDGAPNGGGGDGKNGTVRVKVTINGESRYTQYSLDELPQEVKDQIQRSVSEALQSAKMRGSESAAIFERVLKRSRVAKKCLSLIKNFAKHLDAKMGYLWSRRTFTRRNLIIKNFPGVMKKKKVVRTMAVAIDESGSMSDQEISEIIYGLYDLITSSLVHIRELVIIRHDVEINVERILETSKLGKYVRKFGGGTSHQNVFKFLKNEEEDKKEKAPCLVVFITDACSDIEHMPWNQLKMEKLWLITGDTDYEGNMEKLPGIGRVLNVNKTEAGQ